MKNSKLLIAVSGGIDSVVLAHLAKQAGFNFSICHCNFKLRSEESNRDEVFVKELAEKLNVSVYTTYFETEKFAGENKLSIQVAARNLRYQWFYELLEEQKYDYVLTAHNANDNLETFLINLTRGTGLNGLTGIPSINKKTVRPLLQFSREEIQDFALTNEVNWREDSSNSERKYVRNKIRHEVIPVLKQINPNILDVFQNTLTYLNESQEIINNKIQEISKDVLIFDNDIIKIDIEKLKLLENKKAYLHQILNIYNFTEWNDVSNLLTAQSGKQLFSKTHRLIKDRKFLLLTEHKKENSQVYFIDENTKEVSHPINLTLEFCTEIDDNQQSSTIYIDKSKITYPLRLRKWQKGDLFYPTGMTGKKKLSKFFKDEKYSLLEKENTWLLCSENDIIWIIGKRKDRRFLSKKASLSTLKVYLTY
ncbi:tRNA lysidine(34) synthetase TilS [Pseudotenacibaculum sp. MALMAid0570]|uniref:tRNA lysidine(34) synthetase TilS n=1 Tax=Pseudotenacibaculum sp. MALMAid0570 TaxID=3143938 RepID=UPI0032E006C7